MPFGVYLHIPYCVQKCRYCDFYSMGGASAVPEAYLDALLRALERHQAAPGWRAPDTVYFGGGTPSLLTAGQLRRLLAALAPAADAEVTLEVNPGTADAARLAAFGAAGVTRLSVGVQTASDAMLARLGRIHTVADSRRTLRDAAAAGFAHISGDVMLALPQDTPADVEATLALLAQGGVDHISAYLLKIEPNTPFGRTPPPGLPDEDAAADFYLGCVEACRRLGYAQYEISNFARPGGESRHNLLYWDCEDYLGLGPAAHSCMAGRRFYYPPDQAAFMAGAAPVADGLCTAQDYIMLQLRLRRGLSLSALQARFGITLSAAQHAFLQRCAAAGLAIVTPDTVALTPQGMLVQNSILCDLL